MIIRQMRRDDIETIYERGMKVMGFSVSETSKFWTKEQLHKWVDGKDDILLVAEDEKRVVGYVTSQLHMPTGKATIENIYVDEKYRRGGVGSDLINECLKQLKERGATYVCGMVKTENESTVEFFKSLGFNKGYDFAWMEKVL